MARKLSHQVDRTARSTEAKEQETAHERAKKCYGTSISSRPEIALMRIGEGHWEGNTVIGKRDGRDAVNLSLLEKKTETCLAFRIPSKTSAAALQAMQAIQTELGDRFSKVLRPLPWTTAASLLALPKWNNGVQRCSSHILTHHGSERRTNGTTVCFGLTSPRAFPSKNTAGRTSFPLLMN